MEDPGEEWEIEEYYANSGEEECKSKVSWILNKGLQLGKTAVITGVVLSTAPLVLPPLVVVSALGFAVSIPFGVVYASYACTEKIMSKFLPIPASSPTLEYDTGFVDEAEEEGKSEFAGELVLGEEVNVVENGIGDSEKVEQENLYKVEGFKEKGYEEDVGEYLEGKEKVSHGGTNIKIEGVEKEVDKQPLIEENKVERPSPEEEKKSADDVTKMDELVVVARGVRSDIGDVEKTSHEENKVLKDGTTSLLEKTRDEGNIGESAKKSKKKNKHHVKKPHGVEETKEDKHGKKIKEMDEKLNVELVKKGDETVPDAKRGKTKGTAKGLTGNNVVIYDRSSGLASGKPVGNQRKLTNGDHAAKKTNVIDVEKPVAVDKEDRSIGSDLEKREIAGGIPVKIVKGKNMDLLENQLQTGVPKSKDDGIISSNETSPSEAKIWEQINAMRRIVGYKAAPQSSCMEELKALYIFTGVEPPSSFNNSFDLREAENKLHFLMSIVGVK